MALNTNPVRLELELMPEHTKSQHRQDILLRSLMEKNWVEVLVELEIFRKLRIQPVEEERVVSR